MQYRKRGKTDDRFHADHLRKLKPRLEELKVRFGSVAEDRAVVALHHFRLPQ